MKKICTSCKLDKEYEDFYIDKRTSTGRFSVCRKCHYQKYQKYQKNKPTTISDREKYSPEARLGRMFYQLKYRVLHPKVYGRKFNIVTYSFEDFKKHMIEKTGYSQIHRDWLESGCQYKYTPSVDRIDNNKGYELDNVQCLTFLQNAVKRNRPLDPKLRLEEYAFKKSI